MKVPIKFISPLEEKTVNELKSILTNSKTPRVRQRAHGILLSDEGFSIDQIANILDVGRDTVSAWIDCWEQHGFDGLNDKPRSGGPSKLTQEEKKLVISLASETPRSVSSIVAKLFEITGKQISETTIKRILKIAGLSWKRIRKSMKDRRNEEEFEAARLELEDLKKQHKEGDIELWYFDESGFSLEPSVPYAWQPIGDTLEVQSQKNQRLNVFEDKVFLRKTLSSNGFLTPDNRFESFCFEQTVNTDVVIACFDKFSRSKISKPKIVIIDNASIHTSIDFIEQLPKWEKKGLIVKTLPTYSPELNIIETLWRFIKYWWLPFSAYSSFKNLVNEIENILKQIGSKFRINFAC